MRKRTRRFVAMVTLLGLVLFQASVAVHACAMAGVTPNGAHHATPTPSAAMDAHCAGMSDEAAAPTCFEHCNQGDNATAPAASHDAPAATATAFLIVAAADEPAPGARFKSASPPEQTAAPPPLRLSHRLRI